jgi:hypothetical protein
MPRIEKDGQAVTQITLIEVEPDKQQEALSLMTERAHFMARQPGFISPAPKPRWAAHRQLRPVAKSRTAAGGSQIAGLSQGLAQVRRFDRSNRSASL